MENINSGSSIHFEKLKNLKFSVFHNERIIKPNYLLKKDSLGNRTINFDNHNDKYKNDIFKRYDDKMSKASRQALQDKRYSPYHEGILNLKLTDLDTAENTVRLWASEFEKLTNHKVLSAYIHFDEGKTFDDGKTKHNAHAHIIVDRTTDDGKSIKLEKVMLSKIQTMTADTTGLVRGKDVKDTKRKHLTPQQWKQVKAKKPDIVLSDKETFDVKEKLKDKIVLTDIENDNQIKVLKSNVVLTKAQNDEQVNILKDKIVLTPLQEKEAIADKKSNFKLPVKEEKEYRESEYNKINDEFIAYKEKQKKKADDEIEAEKQKKIKELEFNKEQNQFIQNYQAFANAKAHFYKQNKALANFYKLMKKMKSFFKNKDNINKDSVNVLQSTQDEMYNTFMEIIPDDVKTYLDAMDNFESNLINKKDELKLNKDQKEIVEHIINKSKDHGISHQ